MRIKPFESTYHRNKPIPPEIQLLELHSLDASDKQSPCAWVFLHREEKCTYRNADKEVVEEASITLTYTSVDTYPGPRIRAGGTFTASYSRWGNCISLTGLSPHGRGAIMLADGLRGMRLGTYIFNIIVGWAKQWPDAQINSIRVEEVDAYEENRLRRNRFYEQFGLMFDYADDRCRSGRSRLMPARDLHQVDAWEQNIIVHSVDDHLGMVLKQNYQLRSDLAARERAIATLSARLDHQAAHPIRTAAVALWALHAKWIVPLLVILALAAEHHWFGKR